MRSAIRWFKCKLKPPKKEEKEDILLEKEDKKRTFFFKLNTTEAKKHQILQVNYH